MTRQKKILVLVGMLAVLSMLFTACGPAATATVEPTQAGETAVQPAATVAAPTAEAAVVIHAEGPFRGVDETNFQTVIAAFEAANPGITVEYGGTDQFETVINVQIEAGATPDVAAVPQPGLVAKMAAQGAILPLPDEIAALYDANYSPAWKALATFDGKLYGVFVDTQDRLGLLAEAF